MPRSVLVVEDEPKIRRLVCSYLHREGYVTVEAFSGHQALERAGASDLVILDLGLPDLAGEQVVRLLRQTSAVPIIVLTAKASEAQRIAGLQLGADDYVTKPFSPRELVARVQAVLRRTAGEAATPTTAFGDGALLLDTERREVRVAGQPIALTRTEFDLLSTLAARPGRVWSRWELVSRTQGDDHDGDERTIDAHVKNLRRKLGDHPPDPRFVATVPGIGYKLGVDRDE